jgi:hypothetical protein
LELDYDFFSGSEMGSLIFETRMFLAKINKVSWGNFLGGLK